MTDGLEEMGLPPPGHNRPPPDVVERADTLIDTVNRWLAERPLIVDAEQAGAAQLLVDQLRKARDDLDAERKAESEPLDLALYVVRLKYKRPTDKVEVALDAMRPKLTDWLQRERNRLNTEATARKLAAEQARAEANAAIERASTRPSVEAELAAREATAAALDAEDAAGSGPARARVKGDYAERAMSLRSNWQARIVDEQAALKYYAKHPAVRIAALAAIRKIATSHAKQAKDPARSPPGVLFYNDEGAA